MDGSFISFFWDSSFKEREDLNGIDVGSSCFTNNTLSLDSHNIVSGTPNMVYEGESSKNTINDDDEIFNLHDEISLDLNLGFSGSSSGGMLNRKNMQGPEKGKPKIDLELSLSTCGADSGLTSVGVETLTLSSIHRLVDEGSTSSKWKRGGLVALVDQLLASKASNSNQLDDLQATEPVITDDHATPLTKQPRKTPIKTCQYPGCQKGARGASGKCISHGGGRRCQRPGCQKGAEGKTVFCKAHGGGRRCGHLGCTKSAEGKTNHCISHGGGRRCTYPDGCDHAARGKTGLCIRHGGGKRCKIEHCTRSAEGQSGLCIGHGGGRRCHHPECTKGAQGSTLFCKAHGGGKRCTFIGCNKGAEGSTLFCKGHGGGKRCSYEGGCSKSVHGGTLYCVSHGGGKRCKFEGCGKSARGSTDFCVRHGGGKRCKVEECGKSAQGSTDFCKAHGGGKRCSWGKLGFGIGEDGSGECDKYARGRIGLCAGHAAEVEGKRVHGNATVGMKMKGVGYETGFEREKDVVAQEVFPFEAFGLDSMQVTLPGECSSSVGVHEGRVHGGSLMAMLRQG